jgi:hypothetical protein
MKGEKFLMRDYIIVHQKSSPNLEIIIMTKAISYIEETKEGKANIGLLSICPSYRMSTGDVCETVETYKEVQTMLFPWDYTSTVAHGVIK